MQAILLSRMPKSARKGARPNPSMISPPRIAKSNSPVQLEDCFLKIRNQLATAASTNRLAAIAKSGHFRKCAKLRGGLDLNLNMRGETSHQAICYAPY